MHRLLHLLPDFVNASPKLRFVARKVEKWLDCEVLLRQEECLSEVSPVLRHPYSDCRDRFGCLKHLIDTHPNLVNSNESLQFLIYLIGDEAYKVYKELERIIRIAKVDLSVDSVLRIAKTIATVRINLPNNETVIQQTLLLTPDHCKIKPLFDIQSILSKG